MCKTSKKPIRVLTVNSHPIVAHGIRSVLASEQRYIVDSVFNGDDCLNKLKECKSDIVLIDLDLSDVSTIELIGYLKEEAIKVVVMAELGPKDYVPAFSRGVSGFLPKNCSPQELLEAMYNVYYNHIYLSPSLS